MDVAHRISIMHLHIPTFIMISQRITKQKKGMFLSEVPNINPECLLIFWRFQNSPLTSDQTANH